MTETILNSLTGKTTIPESAWEILRVLRSKDFNEELA